ncbi:NHL repeat-containing protein [Natronincola peptidivorans]|uniref:NHL repeat-containing protein n=1 Tax=Natronincola peptidivorans TaxID=426128 RepID=A0A1I0DRV2_9FIRM|nr:hypothetical protein [Natronincola peptidivorans]SET34661.1 NHL repeat-containing protein [Natronincola peptidivorans]
MKSTKLNCRIPIWRKMKALLFLLLVGGIFLVFPLEVNAQDEPLPFIIGNGKFGYFDGKYNEAEFRFPYGITHDKSTNSLLVTELYNHRIRQIDLKDFSVTTLAGSSDRQDRFGFPAGGYADGELKTAMFNEPRGLAVAPNGAVLVADTGNHMIRMIYEGQVYTVAGTGEPGFKDDIAINAQFWNPTDIVIDTVGNLLVSDTRNHTIRKIDTAGKVTTFAGKPGDDSILNEPKGLSIDGNDGLYVSDSASHQIKFIKSGHIGAIAGQPGKHERDMYYSKGDFVDGIIQEARFNFPGGIEVNKEGNIFVADSWNHVLRMISSDGNVSTVAGTGTAGHEWDQDKIIMFEIPTSIVYANNYWFVTDQKNNRIVAIPDDNEYRDLNVRHIKAEPDIVVFLDGVKIDFSKIQPFMEENYVLVPLRGITESWNSLVLWDAEERAVIVCREGKKIAFFEDQGDFTLHDNQAMVKLHTLEDKLDFSIQWIDHINTVIIETL